MSRSKNSVGVNRNLNLAISLFVCLFVFALTSQTPAAEWASLKGRFVFDGDLDDVKPQQLTQNAAVDVCSDYKLVSEELVVSENKEIANIVVFVRSKDVAVCPELEDSSNIEPALLDNKDCRFEPHVGFVRPNQVLRISNSDPTGHNSNVGGIFTQSNNLIASNDSSDVTFNRDEPIPVGITCNIHPWMKAYVAVTPNPYCAVSEANGTFEIKNLPVGQELEYVFWHEKNGFLKEFEIAGKKFSDKKGRYDFEVEDGGTDLGDIIIEAKIIN